MSSTEQELRSTNDKPKSPPQPIDTTAESKPDEVRKDCGDIETQKIDDVITQTGGFKHSEDTTSTLPPNQVEININSEFDEDDDDDFNSDDMHLKWEDDDDDEMINNEKSKDSESKNPSTSLVTAVKELENALKETNTQNLIHGSSVKKNEVGNDVLKEPESSSSKEILDDIDKLIGNDETTDLIKEESLKKDSEKIDAAKILTTSEEKNLDPVVSIDELKSNISKKMDDSTSISSTKVETKSEANIEAKCINLDDSTESVEIINESSLLSSTMNNSILEGNTKFEHGLKKPDMMLEIPTQEIIDCLDDFDSDNEKNDEKVEIIDVSKQINSLEEDIDSKALDNEIERIDQELTENISALTEKSLDVDEKVEGKENSVTKLQGSEMKIITQQIVGNISDLTEKDEVAVIADQTNSVKEDIDAEVLGNEIEMIDKQISDIISESTAKDKSLEISEIFSMNKNKQDSENVVNDVEMFDVSESVNKIEKQVKSQILETENQTEISPELLKLSRSNEPIGTPVVETLMEVEEIETSENVTSQEQDISQPLINKDLEKDQIPIVSSGETKHKDQEKNIIQTNEKVYKKTSEDLENKTTTNIRKSCDLQPISSEAFESVAIETLDKLDEKPVKDIILTTTDETVIANIETAISDTKSVIKDTSMVDKEEENVDITTTPVLEQKSGLELPSKESKLSNNIEPITTTQTVKQKIETEQPTDDSENKDETDMQTLKQPSTDLDIKESSESTVLSEQQFKDSESDIIPELVEIPASKDAINSVDAESKLSPIVGQPCASKDLVNTVHEKPKTKPKLDQSKEPTVDFPIAPITLILDRPSTSKTESDNSVDQEATLDKQNDNNSQPSANTENEESKTTPILDQSKEPTVDSPIAPTTMILKLPSTSKTQSDNSISKEATSDNLDDHKGQIPDTTDEVPEMEDTLGLLAESSRVVEDAEGSSEGGDAEEDEEGDEDDDFDPDDESSNQMTGEHSEESNTLPEKEDVQTNKEDRTPEKEKDFNFALTTVTSAEDGMKGDDMELTTGDSKVPDDAATPEEATAATDATNEVKENDKETKETAVSKGIETVKLSDTSDNETDIAASILKGLLSNEVKTPTVKTAQTSADTGVVDLESSSEDDFQEINKKKTGEEDVDKKEETKSQEDAKTESTKPEAGASSEVFNLDSDDDDVPSIANEIVIEEKPESNKCINPACRSGAHATYVTADVAARAYFDANKKKKYKVCLACADAVAERTKGLVSGIKGLTPLLELDLRKVSTETVEISDSDSEDGETDSLKPDIIGEGGAKFLEEHLADLINETWIKYKLDERLGDAQSELNDELAKLEAESKEIDTMLNECQVATDLLRNQLYATFEPERRELTAICIVDTPTEKYSFCESALPDNRLKRKSSSASEQPAKKPAIPLGYTPIETEASADKDMKQPPNKEDSTADDDKDVSVVKLSAEVAPSDLPPPGEISRPQLRPGMSVFAMRNSFCTWLPGKIIDVHPKNPANPFTMCRVRFEIRTKIATRLLAARCLAYLEPAEVRLTIGTRVIALSKENANKDDPAKKKSFYSGIVAEIPNPVNNYRYLIFFDHGYAQYVQHRDTRVVCESSSLVWEEVHPNSREFVKQYLLAYPERPMVRLHAGQSLKTEWNGKWWVTRVLQVDASLVEVSFEDNRSEWIYRGSTRLAPLFLELQAAERQRARPLPRSNQRRMNMPYVEYTRSEEQNKAEALAAEQARQQQQQHEELRRQRAVAKKSTAAPAPPPQPAAPNLDSVTSRVVYYTPKNAVKPHKMSPHTCSPKCKRTDTLALKDLRTYNPLAKPLLSGWERQIIRFKGHKEVMYRAPCGRRLRNIQELHRYLRTVQSDMGVDLFDFGANTHCLAEFVLNKCLVGKKDLSHGKENVPVPCVNYYDESLPEFCSYNTERTPTAGVPLNLDPEFLCGCDCTDDCEDKSKCACWKMTLEGARTIGLQGPNIGYEYKRLQEPLPSGIYECNSRCKCKHTCLNRVAQHPLQLKLQVFKTMNRGWGIRALNDVPKGSFLCVYAGNLLTDATANLDGLNEGDEYLAELDYIEVVEQMKEGYEEDIPEGDKKLDRKSSQSSSEEEESSSEEESANKNDKMDDDFQPGFIGLGLTKFNKRLRKRDRTRRRDAEKQKGKEIDKGMEDDGCITISDDEEAKEPTRFMAQAHIGGNEFISKYRSVRTLFGKDEACYIMDAKVQGNIGRYLNHSCTPNVFVQNVFVDTHDPRFPWVAFFALSHIRAGTELTWNYNYDVGSVPGKVLYCYCGAPNCRGRLL